MKLDQPPNGQNAVYFDVLGTTLLHYSARWVLPLSILILIVFIAVLLLGFKKRKLTITGIITGVLLFILNHYLRQLHKVEILFLRLQDQQLISGF